MTEQEKRELSADDIVEASKEGKQVASSASAEKKSAIDDVADSVMDEIIEVAKDAKVEITKQPESSAEAAAEPDAGAPEAGDGGEAEDGAEPAPSEEGRAEGPLAEGSADLDAQADALLRDIEAEGPFALRSHPDAEELDPAEIPPEELGDEQSELEESDEEFTAEEEVDELPESIEIQEDVQDDFIEEYDEEIEYEKSERTRRRLRNTLIFFIVVLVILGAAIGVFVWRNSMSPDVKQSDPDALQTPAAGTNTTKFQPIDAAGIPQLVSYFGMTPEEATGASGNAIALDENSTPTAEGLAAAEAAAAAAANPSASVQAPQPAADVVMYTRNGYLVGNGGEVVASMIFGLGQDGRIIAIDASFDLDAYGVADAKFDELIADRTVASSLLVAVGIDQAAVDEAQLSIKENENAVTSRDTAGREQAEFSGPTNREGAPTSWKVYEVYDHTAGATVGDNSVIRSIAIELR